MRTIIVGLSDRTQYSYPEADLFAYWQQGRIPADALYWTDGMAEWRPITELFGVPAGGQGQAAVDPAQAARAGALSTTVSTPADMRRFNKDPARLTKALSVCLWIYAGLAGVEIIPAAYALLNPSAPGLSYYSLQRYNDQINVLSMVALVDLIVTIVLFCKWVHRANTNVRGFGAEGLEFTPAWAAACFFVPVLNLYRPYQAMSELWRASRDPVHWRSVEASPAVGGWWAFYLLSGLGDMIAGSAMSSVYSGNDIQIGLGITVLSNVLNIISAIAAVSLIKSIYRAQTEFIAKRM